MRHGALLAGLMAAVVAACSATPQGTGTSPQPDSALVSFDGARLDDDGSAIVVSFTGGAAGSGPCTWTYEGDVTETASDVTVRIRGTVDGPPTTCLGIGYGRTVRVALDQPLGERRVIDGATATEAGVLRVALPAPTWLPDGWTAGAESGRTGRWSVVYGRADGVERVTVTVGPAEPTPIPPNSTVTGEVAVQGRGARWVLPNSVGYEELVLSDARHAVVLAPYAVDRPTVERVAESLRPLPIAAGAAAPALPG